MALAPIQRDGRLTPAPPSSDGGGTPLRSDFLIGPTSPKYGYFREPRHSSMRSASGETKSLSVLSEPSNVSTAYDPGAASPPSSSQGGSVDDSWHDTRSMPLGPRWHDYTYREGDAFYGPAPTNEPLASTSGKAKAAPMSVTPTVKSHRSWNALGEAFGSVKQTIASSLSAEVKKPDASGFQVIRPPRQSSQLMPNPEPEAASAEDVDSISSE